MLRRSCPAFAGFVEFHEWHLHEPLLQNYEGWRILDNPKYDNKIDAYIYDMTGNVRHLDPIIDDPRLTHKQRVCRLYKWALKELQMYLVSYNAYKFNWAYKVVRNRFEKYRYVTDPAMCDLMVRETQKYLREYACYHMVKRNPTSPFMNLTMAVPMFHPDNAHNYDHWTQSEVYWYDDAQCHRFSHHHPAYAATVNQDRWGTYSNLAIYNGFGLLFIGLFSVWSMIIHLGFVMPADDSKRAEYLANQAPDVRGAVYAEEQIRREQGSVSAIGWDWRVITGTKPPHQRYGAEFLDPALLKTASQ
eukprot:GILI01010276.1.p1 GENE.GILI01010276.1~~GILI01010276.1.p1  ORF type:complete len:321 (+),score=54.19 GILI01010276.1:56-964(+)